MNGKIKKSMLFIGITFSVSWLMMIIFVALGGKWYTFNSSIMVIGFMFIPMVTAIFVQKFVAKEHLKKPLGISFKLNRWFLVAWLLPPLIAFATLGISLFFPGVEYSPEMAGLHEKFRDTLSYKLLQQIESQISIHPIWIALLLGLIGGITIYAVMGFGEELGWRGFLQREFSCLGFWKSSAIIGVIWGIYHAPIILQGHAYPQHPVEGVFMMIFLCLLLAPIFSYIRLKSKSVIATAILHGSINATIGLSILVVKGGSDLIVGVTGLSGFIILSIINLCIFLFDSPYVKKSVIALG